MDYSEKMATQDATKSKQKHKIEIDKKKHKKNTNTYNIEKMTMSLEVNCLIIKTKALYLSKLICCIIITTQSSYNALEKYNI
jgi:hypothetical protein